MLYETFEDKNGELQYSSDQAAFGYITENERLVLLEKHREYCPDTFDEEVKAEAEMSKEDFVQIVALNYRKLIEAKVDETVAIFCAVLRAKMVKATALVEDVKNRGVKVDEVKWLSNDQAISQHDAEEIFKKISVDMMKTIFLGFKAWIGMLVTVFTGRGHHWKEELQPRYDSLWRACVVEVPAALISWKHITRTAMHPFGMARLAYLYEMWCTNNEVPAALIIRRTAMPAGRAYIGVLKAGLVQMSSHEWYKIFSNKYSNEIKVIDGASEEIKRDRYRHHFYQTLYCRRKGDEKKTDILNDVMKLVPFVQAYINVMAADTPLKDQKAVNKLSKDMVGKLREFERVLGAWERETSRLTDIEEYLKKA